MKLAVCIRGVFRDAFIFICQYPQGILNIDVWREFPTLSTIREKEKTSTIIRLVNVLEGTI